MSSPGTSAAAALPHLRPDVAGCKSRCYARRGLSLRYVALDRRWLLSPKVIYFCVGALFYCFSVFRVKFFRNYLHFSMAETAVILLAWNVAAFVGVALWNNLADRTARHKAILASLCLSMAAVFTLSSLTLLLPHAWRVPYAVSVFALYGGVSGGVLPLTDYHVLRLLHDALGAERTRYGRQVLFGTAAYGLVSFGLGLVLTQGNIGHVLYTLMPALAGTAGFVVLVLGFPDKQYDCDALMRTRRERRRQLRAASRASSVPLRSSRRGCAPSDAGAKPAGAGVSQSPLAHQFAQQTGGAGAVAADLPAPTSSNGTVDTNLTFNSAGQASSPVEATSSAQLLNSHGQTGAPGDSPCSEPSHPSAGETSRDGTRTTNASTERKSGQPRSASCTRIRSCMDAPSGQTCYSSYSEDEGDAESVADMPASPSAAETSVAGILRTLLMPRFALFLLVVLAIGIGRQVLQLYLPIYLEAEIGLTPFVVGLASLGSCSFSIVFLASGPYFLRRLGVRPMLAIGLAALTLRLFAVSHLPVVSPVNVARVSAYAVAAEFLNGISFAFTHIAGVQEATACAPEGAQATFQAAYTCMYAQLPAVVVSLVGGLVFEYVRGRALMQFTFWLSLAALLALLLFGIAVSVRRAIVRS